VSGSRAEGALFVGDHIVTSPLRGAWCCDGPDLADVVQVTWPRGVTCRFSSVLEVDVDVIWQLSAGRRDRLASLGEAAYGCHNI
jgi:hypothetical protein